MANNDDDNPQSQIIEAAKLKIAELKESFKNRDLGSSLKNELRPPGMPANNSMGKRIHQEQELNAEIEKVVKETTSQLEKLNPDLKPEQVEEMARNAIFEIDQEKAEPKDEITASQEKLLAQKESTQTAENKGGQEKNEDLDLGNLYSLDYKLSKFSYGNEKAKEFDKNKEDITKDKD
ncbi:MAG: hypothetical protein M0D57_03055 [Sphingobacteriales bacterium JAD_PAG50586_3]|nr:MAG: hypothetical protein M0D57_03055 [Sphingobacteriales bacterium JAD_PAG50586_3]